MGSNDAAAVWVIAGIATLAGAYLVHRYWNQIKKWAQSVLEDILDGINKAIEVTSDAFVYLVKDYDRYYKTIEVYSRNTQTNKTRLISREEEVNKDDIPDEIKQQLDKAQKIKVMQRPT